VYKSKLVLVDAVGGALSSMAAAVARAQGRADVVAATSSELAEIPPEVHAVLEEIGLIAEPVVSLDRKDREGESLQVIDDTWGARLYTGEGELQRMSNARIARDRIELRVRAMLAPPK